MKWHRHAKIGNGDTLAVRAPDAGEPGRRFALGFGSAGGLGRRARQGRADNPSLSVGDLFTRACLGNQAVGKIKWTWSIAPSPDWARQKIGCPDQNSLRRPYADKPDSLVNRLAEPRAKEPGTMESTNCVCAANFCKLFFPWKG